MEETQLLLRDLEGEQKLPPPCYTAIAHEDGLAPTKMPYHVQDDLGGYEVPEAAAARHVESFSTRTVFEDYMRGEIQSAFISKVYAILALQVSFTFLWSIAVMDLVPSSVRLWLISTMGVSVWVNFVLMIFTICAISAYKQSYPANMLLLSLFTTEMSFMMGCLAAAYKETGQGDIVLMAWGMGSLMFVGLSAYTYMNPCNHDFASWGTGLFVMLWGLIIGGIFISIFGTSQLSSKILCVVGILVFMAYICYDTWQMSERMQPGDECVAALELYLDIINLVTYIMSLLSKK